jgi:hypothetical protein
MYILADDFSAPLKTIIVHMFEWHQKQGLTIVGLLKRRNVCATA